MPRSLKWTATDASESRMRNGRRRRCRSGARSFTRRSAKSRSLQRRWRFWRRLDLPDPEIEVRRDLPPAAEICQVLRQRGEVLQLAPVPAGPLDPSIDDVEERDAVFA